MMRLFALVFFSSLIWVEATSAQVTLRREDAMNSPSRHAWNLFLTINHPAKDPKDGRGIPDMSKPFGAPNTSAVWETWRAGPEVFLSREQMAAGLEPPDWNNIDPRFPGGGLSKVPEPPKSAIIAQALAQQLSPVVFANNEVLFFNPDGVFQFDGQFGETRMNRATYDFIAGLDPRFAVNKTYKLWSKAGQINYARDWLNGVLVNGKKLPLLSFPVEAMEVKAAWIDLDRIQNLPNKERRFYVYTDPANGKKYGLVTLHIITKDIPNWFWCTFHFKDQLDIKDAAVDLSKARETVDDYGPPAAISGTVWENYKLGGTQTDFTDSIGQPTFLSDAYIEKGIENSSCIGCHARASRSGDPSFTAPGNLPDAVGAPKPEWFTKNGKVVVLQTDFLFSMTIRAK